MHLPVIQASLHPLGGVGLVERDRLGHEDARERRDALTAHLRDSVQHKEKSEKQEQTGFFLYAMALWTSKYKM